MQHREHGYSSVRRGLHWLSVPVLLLALYTGYFIGGRFAGLEISRYRLHITLGVLMLLVMLLRLGLRLRQRRSAPGRSLSDRLAEVMHLALYALIILQPLLALISRLGNGRSVTLAGDIIIAPLYPKGTLPPGVLMAMHEWVGQALLILMGLHVAAALFHHLVLRDGILLRMWPVVNRRKQ